MSFEARRTRQGIKPSEDAFQRIVKLASIRERSSAYLLARLVSEGYTEEEVDAALSKAIDYNIVNDLRYAECYLRTQKASGKGIAKALRDLQSLGIDVSEDEDIQSYIIECEDTEEQRAMELLCHKPPRSRNLREGAYRRLISAGYSSQVASSVSRRWAEAQAVS